MTPVAGPHRGSTPLEGWRHAWATHGSTVLRCAAVTGLAPRDALKHHIAPAMLDPLAPFDPLEAMVAPLVRGARRRTRRAVAAVLVAEGVTPDRARRIARHHGSMPVGTAVPEAHPIAFDAVRDAARTNPPTGRDAGAPHRRRPVSRPRRALTLATATSLVAATTAGLVVTTAVRSEARVLFAANAADGWELIRSEADVGISTRLPASTVQDFTDRSGTRKLRVTLTPNAAPTLLDRSLGALPVTWRGDDLRALYSYRLPHRVVALLPRAVPARAWTAQWLEPGMDVAAESVGFRKAELLAALDGLVLSPASPSAGFTPARDAGLHLVRTSSIPGGRSSLRPSQHVTFRSPTSLRTVDVTVSFEGSPDRIQRAAPLFRTASPRPAELAQAAAATLDEGGPEPTANTRGALGADNFLQFVWWANGARIEVLSEGYGRAPHDWREQVARLAGELRPVDERTWRAFDARSRVQPSPSLSAIELGPLVLTTRESRIGSPQSRLVCARSASAASRETPAGSPDGGSSGDGSTCALWENAPGRAVSWTADLIVDGRWWHLERFGLLVPPPSPWRTAPPIGLAPTFERKRRNGDTWRATDFGTRTRAARTEGQDGAFARPVASAGL